MDNLVCHVTETFEDNLGTEKSANERSEKNMDDTRGFDGILILCEYDGNFNSYFFFIVVKLNKKSVHNFFCLAVSSS